MQTPLQKPIVKTAAENQLLPSSYAAAVYIHIVAHSDSTTIIMPCIYYYLMLVNAYNNKALVGIY